MADCNIETKTKGETVYIDITADCKLVIRVNGKEVFYAMPSNQDIVNCIIKEITKPKPLIQSVLRNYGLGSVVQGEEKNYDPGEIVQGRQKDYNPGDIIQIPSK